jgi:hypothetical protein
VLLINEDLCIFCCQERETIHHIIWASPSAQDVWSVSGRELQKCRRGRDDFLAVVEEIMNLPREETMSIFALTARGIWRRRKCGARAAV